MTIRGLVDRLGGLAFGGDYNPEQWDEPVWKEDDELMRRTRVNLGSRTLSRSWRGSGGSAV